ncbi:MAG: histidinol-phosphate transaminase [Gammaproteobacteria bacterium]|nr:histidinol-phosphate transaminase [Gammaproteobacteria bacterium]
MENVNNAVLEISPYQPGKPIEELERERGIVGAIKLASNENPRGPSAAVREAIKAATDDLSRYPDGSAYRLRNLVASRLGVDPTQLTFGNGSDEALKIVGRVVLSPGDRGLVDERCFVVYPLTILGCNAEPVRVPSKGWAHDLEAIASAIDERTRVIYLANPNNPTGTWFSEDEFRRFMTRVGKRVWVVLDEAYHEYARDVDGYPDGVSLLPEYPNLVVTRTFSKIYGLAALRVGYSVSSTEVAELMNRVRQPFNVNSVALAAAEAALQDDAYINESLRLNQEGMTELKAGFEDLGIEYIPSIGNFISFEVGPRAMEVYDALLNLGVVVRPIANYDMPNHLRVTVGLPEENERFLKALEASL